MAVRKVEINGAKLPVPEVLEHLIDAVGVTGVLDTMADICELKADHLTNNWQDGTTAARWARVGRKIQEFSAKGWSWLADLP